MKKFLGAKPDEIVLKAKKQVLLSTTASKTFSQLTQQEKDEILEYLWQRAKIGSDKLI